MNKVYLLLGANLGDPKKQLQSAVQLIRDSVGKILRLSALYRSDAWGVEDQPPFYNQVLYIQTEHEPSKLLEICQQIEHKLGRVRHKKWGARLIDVDILYYNDDIIETDDLHVPHPYLHLRRFTLLPLCEIAPAYTHPVLGLTNAELLERCLDDLSVNKI